jgi:hypothetical protein
MANLMLMIFQAAIFVLSVIILGISIISYRKSNIYINLFEVILYSVIVFTAFRTLILSHEAIPDEINLGGGLTINLILTIIIIFMPVQFLLYLGDLRKFYTFPPITAFFMILNLYLSGIILYYRIAIIVIGAISFAILFYEGLKRKNGKIVSFAFVFMYGLSYFPINLIVGLIFQDIGLLVMILGATGFLDKYILIDEHTQEKIHKIKNTWIARRVLVE